MYFLMRSFLEPSDGSIKYNIQGPIFVVREATATTHIQRKLNDIKYYSFVFYFS